MLRILQLEEIERKLLEVSALVESYKNHDSAFIDGVENWFKEVEEILQSNRLAVSGSIAGLRGILLSTRGGALPQGIEFAGRPTSRKRLAAAAVDAINRAVNIVQTSIQGDRARIDAAERVALQLIAVARACQLIKEGEPCDGPDYARHLAITMKSSEASVQGVVQLEGLVGVADTIILIDRLLNYGVDQIERESI